MMTASTAYVDGKFIVKIIKINATDDSSSNERLDVFWKKTGISSVQLDLVHGQSNPPQAAEMIKYIMTYKKRIMIKFPSQKIKHRMRIKNEVHVQTNTYDDYYN